MKGKILAALRRRARKVRRRRAVRRVEERREARDKRDKMYDELKQQMKEIEKRAEEEAS